MSAITSIDDINLSAKPGKQYTAIDREWREEFIYFLLVDRFHDNLPRTPLPARPAPKEYQQPINFMEAR